MWRWMIVVGMVLFGNQVQAQLPVPRFSEFFKQTSKQRRRLMEQIALLKGYYFLLKSGYELVDDGLGVIRDIKNGDFLLHGDHFNSLGRVKPVIKGYSKLMETTRYYEQIAQLYQETTALSHDPVFTGADRDAIATIFTGLLSEAGKVLQELKLLTISGHYQLSDDERIRKIDTIHANMKDKYAFAKDFHHSISLLLLQKKREQLDGQVVEKMIIPN